MSEQDLKKVLITCLQSESELYDFCIECLEKIYPDEHQSTVMKILFKDAYDSIEYNGCLPSLETLHRNLENELNHEE
jgi:hypothetical protein